MKSNTEKPKCLGRGIHNNTAFIDKLKKVIAHINQNEPDLDVQLRNNYVNIYYKGGNICALKGLNSVHFDPFYFYLNSKNIPRRDIYGDSNKGIARNEPVYKALKERTSEMLQLFKGGEFAAYFKQARVVMDKYWISIGQECGERKDQQALALENKYEKSDYTILDLEYQVSELAPYKCTYKQTGKTTAKKPRFDIIAINKEGLLFAIELKKGTKALSGTSGLQEHFDCYKASLIRDTTAFMTEMKEILKQKIELKLLPEGLSIKSDTPQFMFALTYAEEKLTLAEQRTQFIKECQKVDPNIPYIILPQNTFLLKDENHKS